MSRRRVLRQGGAASGTPGNKEARRASGSNSWDPLLKTLKPASRVRTKRSHRAGVKMATLNSGFAQRTAAHFYSDTQGDPC